MVYHRYGCLAMMRKRSGSFLLFWWCPALERVGFWWGHWRYKHFLTVSVEIDRKGNTKAFLKI